MSLLNNLLSSIDPTAATPLSTSSPRQTQAAGAPKPTARPTVSSNGASQAGALKRKADSQPDGAQTKVQRKDVPAQPVRPNGAVRLASVSEVTKAKPSSSNLIPYRGTAGSPGLNAAKPVSKTAAPVAKPAAPAAKKPIPPSSNLSAAARPAASAPKPAAPLTKASSATIPGTVARPPAKKGYAAMLAQAKQREQIKAPAPPVRHEVTKILTKKEREALRAAAKGKSSAANAQKSVANPTKAPDAKPRLPEKGKPAGYQGTARPAKKAIEIGYKGTAKPSSSTPDPTGKAGAMSASKPKQKQQTNRYDGYANWSDLDEMEDEEEDYESEEDLSDMEGGLWDVEEEEQLALKSAKREDAEALAEENELKRQKEERKRKLAAMAKAAAGRKKY